MPVYISEWTNEMDRSLNERVLGVLHAHYPNHPWAVETKGGMVLIRNLNFGVKWCMARRFHDIADDPVVMKREVIRAGGEFLERGHLKRGVYEGEKPKVLEGAKKWTPPWQPTNAEIAQVIRPGSLAGMV